MDKIFRNFEPVHNNKPQSPLARTIETVRTKCIIFGEALKDRGQKFEQTLPENCSKKSKIGITECKFSKFFRGACPQTPLESFCYLSCL